MDYVGHRGPTTEGLYNPNRKVSEVMDLANVRWRKPGGSGESSERAEFTESSSTGGAHHSVTGEVLYVLRDSKDSDSSSIVFTATEWNAFLACVKHGDFDIQVSAGDADRGSRFWADQLSEDTVAEQEGIGPHRSPVASDVSLIAAVLPPADAVDADYRRDARAVTSRQDLELRKELDNHNYQMETRRKIRDSAISMTVIAFNVSMCLLLLTVGIQAQEAVRFLLLGLGGSFGGYVLRSYTQNRRHGRRR